jgi:putative FmdB family regulatory protein
MPCYGYRCEECRKDRDKILSYKRMKTEPQTCTVCGSTLRKLVDMPAKTKTLWNDGWTEGLSGNGYFSQALGKQVPNRRYEDKVMNQKGFVRESDLGKNWIEEKSNALMEQDKLQQKLTDEYSQSVTYHKGDTTAAQQEVFSAKRCLDGTLDKAFNTNVLKD